jgi:hypothetical protein
VKRVLLAVTIVLLAFPSFGQDSTSVKSDSIPRKGAVRKMPAKQPVETARTGSRVLDDSTKNVYGPRTTMWMSEREYFTGQGSYRPLDTALRDFHRWMRVQQLDNRYHDLGNNGTALNPIFPEPGEQIGASPGYTAYGEYIKAYDMKVYNTRSPFTRMYFIWGSQGRAVTDAEYSRNITPKWNVSFAYRALLSDKLILRQGKGDRQVIEHYYDIHTHYATPKDFYKVRVGYQRIRHRVRENGGLEITSLDSSYNAYFGDAVAPRLRVARNAEQTNNVVLQHQLGPKQAHVYHQFDFKRQINWFRVELNLEQEPENFFDYIRLDSPQRALDSVVFTTFHNQIGVKGNFGKRNQLFYNGYARLRSYNFYNWNMQADTLSLPMKANEFFTGGEIQYALDSLQHLSVLAETLDGGYGKVILRARTRWLDADARRQVSKPTFLQTGYAGTFDLWENSFNPVSSTQVSAFPKVTVGPLFLSAGATFTSFKNYIYLAQRDSFPGTSQQVLPLQARSDVTYVTPEARMDLTIIKRIHIRPRLLYTQILSDAESVLRIPKLFFNGQLAFEDHLFKGKLEVQIGVDVHWQSSYQPMGYDLVNQVFYNQDQVTTPAYLIADVFFTGKMKRGRFFFKYYNAGQLLTRVGYMPTPYYRSAPNLLDFGIDMLLFD